MALLWADGFDYTTQPITTGNLEPVWESRTQKIPKVGSVLSGSYFSDGRGGRGNAYTTNGALPTGVIKTPTLRDATINESAIVGFAVKPLTSFRNNGNFIIIGVNDYPMMAIRYTTGTNVISFYRGNSQLSTTSSANLIDLNVWQYLEFKVFFHASNGYLEIRKNGVSVWSASGLNTLYDGGSTPLGEATWDSVSVSPGLLVTSGISIDDFYVCDTSGSKNNDFLGDISVDLVTVASDGYRTDWSPSSGTDHSAMVDDIPFSVAPSDSDYVDSTGSDQTESFKFNEMPSELQHHNPIYGVMAMPFVRNTNALNKKRLNTTSLLKGQTSLLEPFSLLPFDMSPRDTINKDTYVGPGAMFETEPLNGQPWTIRDLNNAEFGVKSIA